MTASGRMPQEHREDVFIGEISLPPQYTDEEEGDFDEEDVMAVHDALRTVWQDVADEAVSDGDWDTLDARGPYDTGGARNSRVGQTEEESDQRHSRGHEPNPGRNHSGGAYGMHGAGQRQEYADDLDQNAAGGAYRTTMAGQGRGYGDDPGQKAGSGMYGTSAAYQGPEHSGELDQDEGFGAYQTSVEDQRPVYGDDPIRYPDAGIYEMPKTGREQEYPEDVGRSHQDDPMPETISHWVPELKEEPILRVPPAGAAGSVFDQDLSAFR